MHAVLCMPCYVHAARVVHAVLWKPLLDTLTEEWEGEVAIGSYSVKRGTAMGGGESEEGREEPRVHGKGGAMEGEGHEAENGRARKRNFIFYIFRLLGSLPSSTSHAHAPRSPTSRMVPACC